MVFFLFMLAGFIIVLCILPIIPSSVSMKGKLIIAFLSLALASVLLAGFFWLTMWHTVLIYTLLALAASYGIAVYGFPKWAAEDADLENRAPQKAFAEELSAAEPVPIQHEPVFENEQMQEQEPLPADIVAAEEPVLNADPLEDEWEPKQDGVAAEEPLELIGIERANEDLVDEDDYITALYSEEDRGSSLQEDQLAESGASGYLSELLEELNEDEAKKENEMDELPLLDTAQSKKRTDA